MPRIWVTGAAGMLAADLIHELVMADHDVFITTREECDIADSAQIESHLGDFEPDAVINCAAYTKVDDAEKEAEASRSANALGPGVLARACAARKVLLVHISTDYVFDGTAKSPYREDAPVNPLGAYGRHKLEGEQAVTAAGGEHLIVRTSGLYGLHGRCFPATVMRLLGAGKPMRIVNDQITVPTFTPDLAAGLLALLHVNARGIVNCVNSGQTNWYELALAICEECGFDKKLVTPIPSAEYQALAPRPAYSVLSLERFQQLTGMVLRPWRDAIQEYCGAALAENAYAAD